DPDLTTLPDGSPSCVPWRAIESPLRPASDRDACLVCLVLQGTRHIPAAPWARPDPRWSHHAVTGQRARSAAFQLHTIRPTRAAAVGAVSGPTPPAYKRH